MTQNFTDTTWKERYALLKMNACSATYTGTKEKESLQKTLNASSSMIEQEGDSTIGSSSLKDTSDIQTAFKRQILAFLKT